MPRIEVDPGQLHGASARQAGLAGQVMALSGSIQATGSTAAGAAGQAGAGAAISDFAAAWSLSLQMLADSVGGLGGNLGAAGDAYAGTDANSVPAGPR
jgi:hypothetical protein